MALLKSKSNIVFVTGKGGVGKSTIAASIAQRLANEGQKTLLVELGEKSFYGASYKKAIEFKPIEVRPNLFIALWSGEECLKEYVLHLLKVRKIVDLFFDNKIMRTFIRAAPALRELAILGKITSGVRKWGPPLEYDRLVVDCFSTGHFLALLRAPVGMGELISTGPMGEQSRNMLAALKNKDLCDYIIVTILEEMATSEAIELKNKLEALVQVPVQVVCNKHYPFSSNESEWLEIKNNVETNESDKNTAEQILKIMKRQSAEVARIKNANIQPIIVPFVFSAEAAQVINRLEKLKL